MEVGDQERPFIPQRTPVLLLRLGQRNRRRHGGRGWSVARPSAGDSLHRDVSAAGRAHIGCLQRRVRGVERHASRLDIMAARGVAARHADGAAPSRVIQRQVAARQVRARASRVEGHILRPRSLSCVRHRNPARLRHPDGIAAALFRAHVSQLRHGLLRTCQGAGAGELQCQNAGGFSPLRARQVRRRPGARQPRVEDRLPRLGERPSAASGRRRHSGVCSRAGTPSACEGNPPRALLGLPAVHAGRLGLEDARGVRRDAPRRAGASADDRPEGAPCVHRRLLHVRPGADRPA